jgi:hypothetical protein
MSVTATDATRMKSSSNPDHTRRIQELANSLACLTEADLCLLYGIAASTAEAWRKRGKGPSYVLAGNNYLYPRDAVAADIDAKRRSATRVAPKSML